MNRELLQQALNALLISAPLGHAVEDYEYRHRLIKDIEAELAKPEQEPVCDKDPSLCGFVQCQLGKACKNTPINTMPTKIFAPNLEQILNAAGFYRREWVGLTDEDTANICMQGDLNDWHDEQVIDAVQAKLKEKNYGSV